ncbi:2OG-Fe(II) oxygenase [Thioalkalivibrio sp. ALM2T]|uniref:2OG-Fe(II) oxygenase n=1 Tax=Thioalkalivibrio sp. ALM2T TaxID=1158184 RepID=UPI0009D9B8D7|nr:2OG-Fe(II) oxygenase [Thioalkalivibrio sp. ALM2T]
MPGEGQLDAAPVPDWLDRLAAGEPVVWPRFLEAAQVDALRGELYALRDASSLQQARIGRAGERHRDRSTRGDWIHWLDGESAAQQVFMAALDQVRLEVNRALVPGLFETESHFALYPPGAHYARHVDAFQAGNCRRLSLVFYLNRHWRTRDGGELAIYDRDAREIQRIQPRAGTLVMFLSQDVPHAVLPTRRWRASIASWMRVRDPAGPLASLDRY